MAQIKIQNLSFGYANSNVLENISLEIKNRDFIAIIGPNGGGKTTLLKLILGLISPYSGSIDVFGMTPSQASQKLGYVPQDININLGFPIRVIEVVLMGILDKKNIFFGYSKKETQKALEALKKVGMQDFANRKINTLSGGQRQKVFIARALCASPQILILDEPTSSIDAHGEQDVYEILKELNKEITIVVVSHGISLLLDFAKKIFFINRTLLLHDTPSMSKAHLVKSMGIKDNHLCEVDILNYLSKARKNV